jgi:hypothetical protein
MKKVWQNPSIVTLSVKEVTLNTTTGTVYDSAVLPGQPINTNLS